MDGRLYSISNKTISLLAVFTLFFVGILYSKTCSAHEPPSPPRYVGSKTCEPCHKSEYRSFNLFAKKSKSYQSIERLKKGLSPEDLIKCYGCHTTGYGKPGGFISPEKTPDPKNDGCEVCHGPGEIHVRTKNPADIKSHLTRKDCETCHTSERIKSFRYTPLIHGGGH